jgi:TRAP-type mannitol/chloroaromatic compound transport system permease large subunit
LTPPFGLLLFTMKGVAPPEVTMNDVFGAALPYVGFGLLALLIVFSFPPVAIWLPRLIGE